MRVLEYYWLKLVRGRKYWRKRVIYERCEMRNDHIPSGNEKYQQNEHDWIKSYTLRSVLTDECVCEMALGWSLLISCEHVRCLVHSGLRKEFTHARMLCFAPFLLPLQHIWNDRSNVNFTSKSIMWVLFPFCPGRKARNLTIFVRSKSNNSQNISITIILI